MDLRQNVKSDPRSRLPSIGRLVGLVAERRPELPAWSVTAGCREVVAGARGQLDAAISGGDDSAVSRIPSDPEEWIERAAASAAALAAPHPRRVVNATGVLLHTNLGRSPLAQGAAAAASEAAAGYSNLELDLATGRRGNRLAPLVTKLRLLGGAPGAYACNNNAAAVLLALDTVARGREVVVSRGELVEIGGSFRVPDIMERAGVRLVEVGTTNRTHARDYEAAIGEETALLLKVHRSNFQLQGFTAEVGLDELVAIGRERGVAVMEDLGSGTFLDLRGQGLPDETYVPGRLASGADIVCFSGDKLLGGPQAGLVLGRSELVDAMRSNPLARALRLDKMSLAALDWTLEQMLSGQAEQQIPLVRQMLEPLGAVERRARDLMARLEKHADGRLQLEVEPDRAPVGGGSIPGFSLDTWAVGVRGGSADRLAARLREAATPVLARIRDDAVLLDVRTLQAGDEVAIEAAFAFALSGAV